MWELWLERGAGGNKLCTSLLTRVINVRLNVGIPNPIAIHTLYRARYSS